MENIRQLFVSAGGATLSGVCIIGILSLLQVSKIQINPWDALRRWVGQFFGAEHTQKITLLEKNLEEIKALLESHIRISDERNANRDRRQILAFERELQWNVQHTKEDFEDVLETIARYEEYCATHPEYKNNIAKHAISHIDSVYDERLKKRDFAKVSQGGKENAGQ